MLSRILDILLAMPRPAKRLIALLIDVCLLVGTVAFSFYIRLDEWVRPTGNLWLPYIVAVLLALPIFVKMGLYRAIFRHAGLRMLTTIGLACLIYGLLYATFFTIVSVNDVPRTIGILQPLLLMLAILASRVSLRMVIDWRSARSIRGSVRRPVLIYGAGAAGRQLAAAAQTSSDLEVIAFLSDDRTLHGGIINGLDVFAFDRLADLVESHAIEEILLAQPTISRAERQRLTQHILGQVAGRHVIIRTLPTLLDLAHGKVTVSDLREVEIDDLLGRDPVPPNRLLLAKNIRSKTVIVTGAGGSIGSELCIQILAERPRHLVLVDVSEYNLYAIHRTLSGLREEADGQETELVPLLGSVQNRHDMEAIIAGWRPDTIYHAAAYKHVPLVEANVAQGIQNNVLGTRNMALLAREYGVADFVLISTDKAVRPTNAMGATKRLAEQILQALAAERAGTRFAIVRFGNVLGSSGSVVPLFREQISRGGPITLTHSKVTRYFMTIPEAAQLVIQAGAMAQGGEVFVLDMGEPVRIAEMARLMIELSGLTPRDADNPDGDIEIREIGMRPGEKLYEELLIGNNVSPTKHARIMQANEPFLSWNKLRAELETLAEDSARGDREVLLARLRALVPEFEPQAGGARRVPEDLAS